jgi:hypothetical protein
MSHVAPGVLAVLLGLGWIILCTWRMIRPDHWSERILATIGLTLSLLLVAAGILLLTGGAQ